MTPFAPPRRRFLATLALPAAAALLAGCATPPSGDADRAALLARVNAYWQLALKNERVKMWPMEAASLDGQMTIEAYLKRGGITYESAEVSAIHSLEGDTAEVDLQMRYNIPLIRLKNQESLVRDVWRRIDGIWYHAPRPSVAFPGHSS